MLISEWVRGPQYIGARDAKGSIFQTTDSLFGSRFFDQFTIDCHGLNPQVAAIDGNDKGANWVAGGYGDTLYNHNLPPNDHSCLSGGMVQEGAFTAGSRHASGANLLFADCHVFFLSDSVSLSVWRALGTRNGGEVVDQNY